MNNLPDGSVVATTADVYIRRSDLDADLPWITTKGHVYLNHCGDDEIAELLTEGASLLQIGPATRREPPA